MTNDTFRVGDSDKKPSTFKILISTVGALFAISHLGLLGYLIDRKEEPCLLYTSDAADE